MSLDSIAQPHAMSLGAIRPGHFADPMMPSLSSSMSAPKRKRSDDDDGVSSKAVKKSASSASLHNHHHHDVDDEDDAGADSDKKRNKLGYHRTSVACGKQSLLAITRVQRLTEMKRPLPQAQDPLHDARRRPDWPLLQLHPP